MGRQQPFEVGATQLDFFERIDASGDVSLDGTPRLEELLTTCGDLWLGAP
jgi:hypothetical protein